jgi:hypothetical protein
VTTKAQDTLVKAATQRNDDIMMTRIIGEDLIAVEAKYHRTCHREYTRILSKPTNASDEEAGNVKAYDEAFKQLLTEIDHPLLSSGKAYEMSDLLDLFKGHLETQSIDPSGAEK